MDKSAAAATAVTATTASTASDENNVLHHEQQHKFNFVAPVAAIIFPGLGHWFLGYRRRGRLIAGGVFFLYFAGLLIGGISVIDYKNAPWWFYGQCMNGPVTPLIYIWHDNHRAPDDPGEVTNYTYPKPSFSHMNEMGTLYTTLSGMLNLIAILDVVYLARATRKTTTSSLSSSSDKRGNKNIAEAAATGAEGLS